jgi:hypothetical protein
MSGRDGDFTQATKELLAKKAGHTCSKPDCNAPTSGASADGSRSVNQGKAAHINSAADGGPRARPSMTAEQRAEESNGIWLCAACADLIDKNNGVDYPEELLRSWRAARESESSKNVGRPPTPMTVVDGSHHAQGIGEVTGLEINAPARIQPGTVSTASGVGRVTGTRIGGGDASSGSVAPRGQPAKVAALFGTICQKCRSRFGAIGSGGGDTKCPSCGGPLVADTSAAPALASISCSCGWSAGLAVGITKCPNCGRAL